MAANIGTWDGEKETGHPAPVLMMITEDGILLAEIREATPAHAITTALCLLETAHERSGQHGIMAHAVARCAEIMNDATILEAEIDR